MEDPEKRVATAHLTREQKSVLVDILNWYMAEYDLDKETEENVESAIEELEEHRRFDTRRLDTDFVCDTLINQYADELQPYLADLDNPMTAVEFYRDNFSSLTERLQRANDR